MTHHAVFSGYYYDKQLRGVYGNLATAHRAAEVCNGTVEPVEIDPPISAFDGQFGWSVVSDSETRELKVFRCDASSPSFGDETVYDKTITWRRPTFRTLDQRRLIVHGPDRLLRLIHQSIIHGLELRDESELTP